MEKLLITAILLMLAAPAIAGEGDKKDPGTLVPPKDPKPVIWVEHEEI